MKLIKYIKAFESKLRLFLICFCSYSFLYSLTKTDILKNLLQQENNNYFLYIAMFVLSVLIGLFINYELKEYFNEEWDWAPKNKIEKIQNEFFCLTGIGVLYYFSQLGAMILFFPSFESVEVYTIGLYHILFSITTILIYLLYRMVIFKFE